MKQPRKKDQSDEERKIEIGWQQMTVLFVRMSAPRKGDYPEALQAKFLTLAEKIRQLRSAISG